MAYSIYSLAGMQPIEETSTTQRHVLGTIVQGTDPTYGAGEFIYLRGIASTTVGSVVHYHAATYATVLGTVNDHRPRPMAVAMSANVVDQYGWYQISGIAVASKACTVSFAAGVAVGVSSTTGLAIATASGQELQGAIVSAVASATAGRTTVNIMINRPHNQGRIT